MSNLNHDISFNNRNHLHDAGILLQKLESYYLSQQAGEWDDIVSESFSRHEVDIMLQAMYEETCSNKCKFSSALYYYLIVNEKNHSMYELVNVMSALGRSIRTAELKLRITDTTLNEIKSVYNYQPHPLT